MNRSVPMKLAIIAAGVVLGLGAQAADLSAPYLKAPPPPQYTWAGLYAGGNLGGAFGSETGTLGPLTLGPVTFSNNPSGVLGGVQIGYNFLPAPNWLIGVEGDFDWSFTQDNLIVPDPVATATLTSDHHWYATLDGRLGWVAGPWLLYAKAGAAWTEAEYTASGAFAGGAPAIVSSTNTQTGWTVGGGVEYLLPSGWSGKVEYDFLDFDSQSLAPAVPLTGVTTQIHQVKAGVNYHLFPGL
jgi:opacity protein-like surface antigen